MTADRTEMFAIDPDGLPCTVRIRDLDNNDVTAYFARTDDEDASPWETPIQIDGYSEFWFPANSSDTDDREYSYDTPFPKVRPDITTTRYNVSCQWETGDGGVEVLGEDTGEGITVEARSAGFATYKVSIETHELHAMLFNIAAELQALFGGAGSGSITISSAAPADQPDGALWLRNAGDNVAPESVGARQLYVRDSDYTGIDGPQGWIPVGILHFDSDDQARFSLTPNDTGAVLTSFAANGDLVSEVAVQQVGPQMFCWAGGSVAYGFTVASGGVRVGQGGLGNSSPYLFKQTDLIPIAAGDYMSLAAAPLASFVYVIADGAAQLWFRAFSNDDDADWVLVAGGIP